MIKIGLRRSARLAGISFFAGIALVASSAACAETIKLLCTYDDTRSHTGQYSKYLPREVRIVEPARTVSWNDNARTIPLVVSDTHFSFLFEGFKYTISRVTGEIRFHSPKYLKAAADYRHAIFQRAIYRGRTAEQAQQEIDAAMASSFGGREHVGVCVLAGKPKF